MVQSRKISAAEPQLAYEYGELVTVRYTPLILENKMSTVYAILGKFLPFLANRAGSIPKDIFVSGMVTDRIPIDTSPNRIVYLNIYLDTIGATKKTEATRKDKRGKYFLDSIPAGAITHSYGCKLERIVGHEKRIVPRA
jgi:hypothetical protein